MATTTNYSWTTPDDTALVKDGAAAIRSLGTAIDTTVFNNASAGIAKTIVDAKGDIIAATAADTVSRLAVGANDTVLTADSSTATGLKWAAAAGGANFSLLNSGGTALTGASTITVSGISAKDKILVFVTGAASTDGSSFTLRFNADSGSNYYRAGSNWSIPDTYAQSIFGGDSTISGTSITFARNSGSNRAIHGYLIMQGANSSGVKVYNSFASAPSGGGENHGISQYGGIYNSASTISSVSIICGAGTFNAGTIYIYGSA